MAEERRPPTPEPVKRKLRQEAGFGCCVCGIPIYQYHHIIEYSEEQHFRPEDMMILCPNHHDAATQHAMLEEEQRYHKAHPYNIVHGYASGQLTVNQKYCSVLIGNFILETNGRLLTIGSETLLALGIGPRGTLEISLRLYDQHNRLEAVIENNEWETGPSFPWDITSSWQKITIRRKHGEIVLDINTKMKGDGPLELRADLWRNQ
jgi:hypothetical protein